MKQNAPYGSWKSPITADLIVSSSIGLGSVCLEGEDTYWLEGRPQEKGRVVIVRRGPDGTKTDINPPPFNVRTRVHEYGGGAYAVRSGVVYFVNFADQRVYRASAGGDPEPVTPENATRYADFALSPEADWLVCVVEAHTDPGVEAANSIARLDLKDGSVHHLQTGRDFYSSPRISPDGRKLAWLCWDHPNMPWDDVEIWVGDISPAGELANPVKIAGGSDESIMQPNWTPGGDLVYISDRTNWWNLYRWNGETTLHLISMDAEFGDPNWVFGMSNYAITSEDRIIAGANRDGRWSLLDVDSRSGTWSPIETPYDSISSLHAAGGRVAFTAGSTTEVGRIVEMDLATGEIKTLRKANELEIDRGYLSVPESVEFPTENGLTAFGFYYPPKNRDYTAPDDDLPPLLVLSHGGPTGQTDASFSLSIQYWTSRGFAVLDVNYGGSTGYGREYRRRLYGSWGIVDVDDCVNGAIYLATIGRADPDRLAIRGGSAGGYTTLAALAFRKVFKAGASYFGVSDLGALAADTHKFESRYLDQLVGPYPARKDIYDARSPLQHAENLSSPVIFFQGLEDRVVPPNQAEMMVDVLRRKGIPVAYVPFDGEQHGFRQAANIKRALEAEYYFYAKIFGFESADEIEPVEIENL